MRLVGFDADVARAHGLEVVTLPDGSLASVPAAKADAARKGAYVPTSGVIKKRAVDGQAGKSSGDVVSPYGYGEATDPSCGTSWVYLDPIGGARANLGTGMKLVVDAGDPWDVHWHVNIEDNGGNSTQAYSEEDGFLGPFSWTAYARKLSLTRGWAQATVVWYGSYTVTENAWVCWSEGPSAGDSIW
ncbi:hypothetical protein ACNTMW_01455 [Planosporangium sp. 12N6]|uniref:hypothetical protein n=1 Tax=Planosporangium spinosum TaxID=3402278 RepID=UPI003CF7292C